MRKTILINVFLLIVPFIFCINGVIGETIYRDAKGNIISESQYMLRNGVTPKVKKIYRDDNGNIISEKEYDWLKMVTPKAKEIYRDDNGNIISEEEYDWLKMDTPKVKEKSNISQNSQEPIEMNMYRADIIETRTIVERFFGINISGGYFFRSLPESIPGGDFGYNHIVQALVPRVKTSVVIQEKGSGEFIFQLSYFMTIILLILILLSDVVNIRIAIKHHFDKKHMIFLLKLFIYQTILIIVPLLYYLNHSRIYIDNASELMCQVLIDNSHNINLGPLSFTRIIVSNGIHHIKVIQPHTDNIIEEYNINVDNRLLPFFYWHENFEIVYNIGQYNSYRIETGNYNRRVKIRR